MKKFEVKVLTKHGLRSIVIEAKSISDARELASVYGNVMNVSQM